MSQTPPYPPNYQPPPPGYPPSGYPPSGYPPSGYPPYDPYAYARTPHRGSTVLTLGILGLVVCFICGIIAWVMGNNDLREMNTGRMDPSGRDLTNAGRICGMIGTILSSVLLFIYLIVIMGAASSNF